MPRSGAYLRTKKKFYVRYQVNDNVYGLKHMEIHFFATEKAEEENSAIFALRDVNAVVEQVKIYLINAQIIHAERLQDIVTALLEFPEQIALFSCRTVYFPVCRTQRPEKAYRRDKKGVYDLFPVVKGNHHKRTDALPLQILILQRIRLPYVFQKGTNGFQKTI